MASFRETQHSGRPIPNRTSPPSLTMTALPGRQSHGRNNSHSSPSLLTSSLNSAHRITRRKSVTQPNITAITAALRDSETLSASIPISNPSGRRNTVSKMSAATRAAIVGSLPSPPASLPNQGMGEVKRGMGSSAIDDNNDTSGDETKTQKDRMRRASDGQPLSKEAKDKDGKKSSRVELRCEKCGKGYKHSSCLTKHLWEHTPEWSLTSKLLISKHQQVQLLEAASVLLTMNGPEKDSSATPPDSTRDFLSDQESVSSPAASGYSVQADRQSSADTTPPPRSEGFMFKDMSYRDQRHGSFSQSIQSPGFALSPGSAPRGFGHMRQFSNEYRPTSSGFNNTGKEDRDLAAAVELLSCSFGSNNGSHGTVTLPVDAPPVPPLPVQYLDQAKSFTSTGFINSFPSRQPESFTRGELRRGSVDVKLDDQMDTSMDDDDFDRRSRGRSDEDDDGVFGRMEE